MAPKPPMVKSAGGNPSTFSKPKSKKKEKNTEVSRKDSHQKSNPRGQKQPKKKPAEELEESDLMTPEDEELLRNIKDDEQEESVKDIEADGQDIDQAEILSFLSQLNVEKFQPFSSSSKLPSMVGESQGSSEKDKNEGSEEESKNATPENGKKRKNADPENVKKGKAPLTNKENMYQHLQALQYMKSYKTRTFLLVKPGEMWRDEENTPVPESPPDEKLVKEADELAQRLLSDEIAVYTKQRENTKRSEARWLKTVLATGTLSDKMAALTLLVQESPMHNLAGLESLIAMAGKKGRREAMMAVDTLRDLFLTGLLPGDRKLKTFKQHPFVDVHKMTNGNLEKRDKLLLMWYFESLLKKKYEEFIKALKDMSFDTLLATKEKSIATVHQLLTNKPEQENVLLPMLVNKLGDPVIKSKTMYLLGRLVDEHPNMKAVIIREVQQLLHRPNISPRAQYYAICFLTQLRLSKEQSNQAAELIKIYFYFFQNTLKSGAVDNKMMSALLTGVNRAVVYAQDSKKDLLDQMDSVYKIIPKVSFHTGVQALMLLFQVTEESSNASDRFYMSLYRKLGDPALTSSAKQAIFMNLLFKSLKRDLVDRRIKAFLKRILQVYSQQSPQYICSILILLSQIVKDKPGLLDFKHVSKGVWGDDEDEKFVDLPAPEEFNNVVEKEEAEDEEMLSEDTKGNEGLTNGTNQAQLRQSLKGSWVHRKNQGIQGHSVDYDPYGRNPLYSRADAECMWELQDLAKHYHPTVRLYASSLLKGEPIQYDGDPLKDFTLIRFLDRFVYKNPKKQSDIKSSTIKSFKRSKKSESQSVPVNSEEFLNMEEDQVPHDERFFHRYFVERAKKQAAQDKDSDTESITDADFDAFLDKYEKDIEDDADLGDFNLDFAGDKSKTKTKKGKQQAVEEEDDSDDEDEDDEDDMDLEDNDLAAEFQAEMAGLEAQDSDYDDFDNTAGDKHFNEDDIDFSPDEDDDLKMMMLGGGGKKGSKRKSDLPDLLPVEEKKGKQRKRDTEGLFASAEEFSHLLEEEAESGKISLGGLHDVRNMDKRTEKQLKWESQREAGPKPRRKGFKKGGHSGPRGFKGGKMKKFGKKK